MCAKIETSPKKSTWGDDGFELEIKRYSGELYMEAIKKKNRKKALAMAVTFVVVNLIAVFLIGGKESATIDRSLTGHAESTKAQFQDVMDNYKQSFQLFVQMMSHEIDRTPDPDQVLAYLKDMDPKLLEIEGDTYDGLYMYYQGRYLYSWDTPYSVYEESGYVATERPWYKDAMAGRGEIVFTPPYMSYANHYILTTISQLQPDGETVFAYDIKMGDIQKLVSSLDYFSDEQILIYDSNGTVIGSTNTDYLGGNLLSSVEETAQVIADAEQELLETDANVADEVSKLEEQIASAKAFHAFRESFGDELSALQESQDGACRIKLDHTSYYGYLLSGDDFSFLILAPSLSVYQGTLTAWLIPFLIVELLLIYVLGRVSKDQKNRELRAAYVELGQTQKRLEIALSAAQKAAAVDELTGMMNARSFKKAMTDSLSSMDKTEGGILIMLDGDHFKQINDTYGHNIGDEVIKLSAQMIVGRIRTIDLASRLHGDEFAIFVSDTTDYSVARRIISDINHTIEKEAKKRNMPSITLSAGAVIAHAGDSFNTLSKKADEYLYQAKESHDGGFSHPGE